MSIIRQVTSACYSFCLEGIFPSQEAQLSRSQEGKSSTETEEAVREAAGGEGEMKQERTQHISC